MNMADMNKLMACFCKTREIQNLYTKLLSDEELTIEEKEVIVELIQCAADSSKKIVNLCRDIHLEKSSGNNE
jgi:hypothetical protein